MGITSTKRRWQRLQRQDYLCYHTEVIKCPRNVHQVIIYLNLVNFLSKWYPLHSKPKKERSSWTHNISHHKRGGRSQGTRTVEDPEGDTISNLRGAKQTHHSLQEETPSPSSKALRSANILKKTVHCQCPLSKILRNTNDHFSDTDFSSTALDVRRQWNDTIEVVNK